MLAYSSSNVSSMKLCQVKHFKDIDGAAGKSAGDKWQVIASDW